MNNSLEGRLEDLSQKHRLEVIKSPLNEPLVSGEEVILKEDNVEIIRIVYRKAAAASLMNKHISVCLNLPARDYGRFEINNQNTWKRVLGSFTNRNKRIVYSRDQKVIFEVSPI
ncbi:MAG: hypothetical protein P8X57_07335, partial [Cyclobacteriaceae bacterium]